MTDVGITDENQQTTDVGKLTKDKRWCNWQLIDNGAVDIGKTKEWLILAWLKNNQQTINIGKLFIE